MEAYLRLIELRQMRRQDRARFFAMAARIMRRILVDSARARRNQKRGGDAARVSLHEVLTNVPVRVAARLSHRPAWSVGRGARYQG